MQNPSTGCFVCLDIFRCSRGDRGRKQRFPSLQWHHLHHKRSNIIYRRILLLLEGKEPADRWSSVSLFHCFGSGLIWVSCSCLLFYYAVLTLKHGLVVQHGHGFPQSLQIHFKLSCITFCKVFRKILRNGKLLIWFTWVPQCCMIRCSSSCTSSIHRKPGSSRRLICRFTSSSNDTSGTNSDGLGPYKNKIAEISQKRRS